MQEDDYGMRTKITPMKKNNRGWLTSPDLLAKNPRIGWILFFGGIFRCKALANF